MDISLILALSLILQVAAAGIALKQIRKKTITWAWGCMAAALIIMAFRRGVTLTRHIFDGAPYTADPVAEILALVISILMFAGVLGLRKLLDSISRETQSAIEKGKDIFRHYLDMPFVGIALATPSQNWQEFNDPLCSIFGYSREELEVIPWPNLLHPHDRTRDSELFHEILNKKRDHYTAELRFLRKDGEIAHTHFVVQCVRRNDGSIDFLRVIVQDITEQRKAEKELTKTKERFENLVLNMSEGLAELDARGNIVFANQSFCQKMEYSEPELIGKPVTDLFDPEYRPVFLRHFENRKQGDRTSYEAVFRTKSGKRFYTQIAPQPLYTDGEFSGSYAIITDLSQRKKVEDQLEKVNKTLLEADRQKNQFLSSMNHELRTPLTSILGFADILLRDKKGFTEKQYRYLNNIKNSGHHLLSLINDMLDIAKIDAGRDQLIWEELSVEEAVQSVVTLMTPQIGAKNQIVKTDLDENCPTVTADARRLKQILFNLLSNAVKYTPEKGRITIKTRAEGDEVVFFVTDTGPGIRKEDQEIIFDEFKQADPERDSKLGGIGVGLALTRRLVSLHGGRLGLESEEGKGSTFWFSLPKLSKPPQAMDAESEKAVFSGRPVTGKRVLVVEDNENNLAILQDMLEMHHHIVSIARNGEDAIELAKATLPEIILMDIELPGMNGIEAMQLLRNLPEFAHTPIIAITASLGRDQKPALMDSGFTDFLEKPFVFEKLTAMFHKHLGDK